MAKGTVTVICYPGGSGRDLRDAFGSRLARPGPPLGGPRDLHCAALPRLLPDKRGGRGVEVYHRLGSFTLAGSVQRFAGAFTTSPPVSAYP